VNKYGVIVYKIKHMFRTLNNYRMITQTKIRCIAFHLKLLNYFFHIDSREILIFPREIKIGISPSFSETRHVFHCNVTLPT
jgi:hypothetical protein